jgi:hypothetical protein
MPRNLTADPAAARRFADSARAHALDTVLILTETHEHAKYAGADLESFYASLGLQTIHRPIPDFSLPNHPAMVDNVRDLLARLAAGRNCLVHCAGGSGRTGMVVAAVLATLGVQDAVAHVRALKSSYVETPAQERFVDALPAVLDDHLAARHPDLARAIAAERLIDRGAAASAADTAAAAATAAAGTAAGGYAPTQAQLAGYGRAFDLIDSDGSDGLSAAELAALFRRVGAQAPPDRPAALLAAGGGDEVPRARFVAVLSAPHRRLDPAPQPCGPLATPPPPPSVAAAPASRADGASRLVDEQREAGAAGAAPVRVSTGAAALGAEA